ncbi:MAG: hypothetical protein EB084_16830 [Proteobacteria bacterium]|nr:hypothetical protein [Pseudomonadota bacterium]
MWSPCLGGRAGSWRLTIRWPSATFYRPASRNPPEIEIRDVPDLDQIDWFDEHSERVTSLSFSYDCSYLAAGTDDGCVRVYCLETREVVATYAHADAVTCVRFSPVENVLASVSTDKSVMLWRLE